MPLIHSCPAAPFKLEFVVSSFIVLILWPVRGANSAGFFLDPRHGGR